MASLGAIRSASPEAAFVGGTQSSRATIDARSRCAGGRRPLLRGARTAPRCASSSASRSATMLALTERPRRARPFRRTAQRRDGHGRATPLVAKPMPFCRQASASVTASPPCEQSCAERSSHSARGLDERRAAPAPPAPGRCAPSPRRGRGTGAGTRCQPARAPRRPARHRALALLTDRADEVDDVALAPGSRTARRLLTSSSTPSAPTTGVG